MIIDLWKRYDVTPYPGIPRPDRCACQCYSGVDQGVRIGVQAEIAIALELNKPITFLRVNGQAEENPGRAGVERRGGI